MAFIEKQQTPKEKATLNVSVTAENKQLLSSYAEFINVVDKSGEPEPGRALDLIISKVFDDQDFRQWVVSHPVRSARAKKSLKAASAGKPNGADTERVERSHAI